MNRHCTNCFKCRPVALFYGSVCRDCSFADKASKAKETTKFEELEEQRKYYSGFAYKPISREYLNEVYQQYNKILEYYWRNEEMSNECVPGYKFLAQFQKKEDAEQHVRNLSKAYGADVEAQVIAKGLYAICYGVYVRNDHFDFLVRTLLNNTVNAKEANKEEKPKTKTLRIEFVDETGEAMERTYEIIPGTLCIEDTGTQISIDIS